MIYDRKWAPLLIFCLAFTAVWAMLTRVELWTLFLGIVLAIHIGYVKVYFRDERYSEGMRIFKAMYPFSVLLGICLAWKIVILIFHNTDISWKPPKDAFAAQLSGILGFSFIALFHCLYFYLLSQLSTGK